MLTIHKKTMAAALAALAALSFLSDPIRAQVVEAPSVPALPQLPVVPNINNPYGGPPTNPYTNVNPAFSGSNLTNPYGTGFPGYGGYGYPIDIYPYSGIADIVNAQGQFMMNQEMSRILREKAFQEYLRSQKARIELERWIRDTTPSFTEQQRKIARETLTRIQESATPTEIWSGRALNILLKDLTKAGKVHVEKVTLKEDQLRQLNVTVPGGGSLGLLRDNGRIRWPLALTDVADAKTLRDIEILSQDLVDQARTKGSVDVKPLKDLQTKVNELRDMVEKNNLKMPARQYLQALRFLDDFTSAMQALETRNVARAYYDFHDWAKGEKSVEDLVKYMDKQGLVFGPAVEGDEAAYEALYSALARYSYAFNTQLSKKNGGAK